MNCYTKEKCMELLKDIPDLGKDPLYYVFEDMNIQQDDTLFLEFGVYKGDSINYISSHTNGMVYGFDCFRGLPENWRPGHPKGEFDLSGILPTVNSNVVLIKGYFQDTLRPFLKEKNKQISFVHIDSDLYSSAIYILNTIKPYLTKNAIIIFDELVNFEYFECKDSELAAFSEFITNNPDFHFKWIGMKGAVDFTLTKGIRGYYFYMGHSVGVQLTI